MLNVAFSVHIKCEYIVSHWTYLGKVKNCYVKDLDIKAPNQEVESINGDATAVNNDVIGIWISDQVCHFFPQGLTKFFTGIKAFGQENSKLQHLSKVDLLPFSNLARFSSYKGELLFLESDVFTYNKKLEAVTITDSNLMIVGPAIVENLPQLRYVSFEFNCYKKECEESKTCYESIKSGLRSSCGESSSDTLQKLLAYITTLRLENRGENNGLACCQQGSQPFSTKCA